MKLGRTADLSDRLRGLNGTGVPHPFRCVYAAIVADAAMVEGRLKRAFAPWRENKKREFFRMPADCAVAVLSLVAQRVVTEEDGRLKRVQPVASLLPAAPPPALPSATLLQEAAAIVRRWNASAELWVARRHPFWFLTVFLPIVAAATDLPLVSRQHDELASALLLAAFAIAKLRFSGGERLLKETR